MTKTRYDIETFLNVHSATSPTFSADGKTLAFLSDVSGTPQVWCVDTDGGEPRQRTFHDDKVAFAKFAPRGGDLIYGMDQGGDVRQRFYLLPGDGSEVRTLTEDSTVIHTWGGWSPEGDRIAFAANSRDPAYFDAYVLDLGSGAAPRVMEADGLYTVEGWSPDGRSLVVKLSHASFHMDLFLVAPEGGEIKPLTLDKEPSRYFNIRWRKDGSGFYCCTDRGRENLGLAFHDLATGDLTWSRTPEWDVERFELSPDGARIAFVTNEDGYSRLAVMDAATGADVPLAEQPPSGVIPDLAWTRDGSAIAFTLDGSGHNPDILGIEIDGGSLRRRTASRTAGIPRTLFVEPEVIRYPTFDGRQIPAFLYTPREAPPGGRHPVVVVVHGGPESQYLPTFKPEIQHFVHQGYAVLATNVRGSIGYSRTYMQLDNVHRRMDSVGDLHHAALWLGEQAAFDSRRIAVMGGSYGGFMVLAAITRYPDLWAAAVDYYGVANFQTLLANTGPWRRNHRAAEYGDPVRDAEFLKEISPIHQADRIAVPLFVAHGLNDPLVPPSESEQVVESLRARGKDVEYMTIPDEGHGFVKRHNRIAAHARVTAFLERHL